MKKLLMSLPMLASVGFGQYFEGDVSREFGLKTGLVKVNYDSVDGSEPSITLDEFFAAYGYLGAQTAAGFTAGLSIELSAGNDMSAGRTIIYNAVELNPAVEVSFSERLRAFTGFGGSINRIKERAGSIINRDTNFGFQFFAGIKYDILPGLGVLGEYKGKLFITGDYDGNVIHHFNIGVYFPIR
ncbi:MAG TPA: hypothetical protein EYH49_00610 [Aquifex aeolicus]|nr:hypothetical protein [Aquifex aeolicus]